MARIMNTPGTQASADEWRSAVTDLLRILTRVGGWHPAEDLDRIAEVRRMVAGRAEKDRGCPGGEFKSGVATDQREASVTQHSAAGGDLADLVQAAVRLAAADRAWRDLCVAMQHVKRPWRDDLTPAERECWRSTESAWSAAVSGMDAARAELCEVALRVGAAATARVLTPAGVPAEPAVSRTTEQLHAEQSHPDFEYEITEGPRNAYWDDAASCPVAESGDPQWERNRYRGIGGWAGFDRHEEAYWMRRRTTTNGAPR